jgi:myo-inositol-1-phosphate synthase
LTPTRTIRPPTRLGVWIFGAAGGLATTTIVGARAIARKKCAPLGLATETPMFAAMPLPKLSAFVFGGHEIRSADLAGAALELSRREQTIPERIVQALASDLRAVSRRIRPGTLVNAGPAITAIAGKRTPRPRTLREEAARLSRDLVAFLRKEKLTSCVCVNLTSTEPPLVLGRAHESLAAFEQALDADRRDLVRPSTLYAYVAAKLGLPFLHFTPSNATLVPAVQELFVRHGAPFAGQDGKTGETLVKSSLAPMFKYRNLRVLSWQGYNLLGDRDGLVLDSPENKRSKVLTKDSVLQQILGYPLHTHVGIDYVPSLGDHKTAWDLVHFEGFLGHRMSMHFTWLGCDAILAAPLVLDMVRLLALAHQRGESGPARHLSCFFKQPLGVAEHDLHVQWHLLTEYCAGFAKARGRR